jgi:hypothetical protein
VTQLEQILSDAGNINIARRLVDAARLTEQQQKFDAAVAAALDRIQRAEQLQKRIRRTVRG